MRRIPFQTRKRIIELWFKGIPRDSIARRLRVSGDTVSSVVAQLSSDASQIAECPKELRDLSVELRKLNLSSSEALEGAKLLSKLANLGFAPEQLHEFIQTATKLSRKTEYQPKQVIQAAMKLSDLEEKSGKSYTETIREFEAKTKQTKELQEAINEKEKERTQKLSVNRVTDKEIRYIKELRQKFRRYRINLTDVENLQAYLENMQETGGNPKKFVEYTRKYGSLQGRLTLLERQKQQKISEIKGMQDDFESQKQQKITEMKRMQTLLESQRQQRIAEINGLKKEKETVAGELIRLRIAVSEQRREEGRLIESNRKLRKEADEQKARLDATVSRLAEILKVTVDVEEINKAIHAKNEELANLDTSISTKSEKLKNMNSEIEELKVQKQRLEHEVEGILKIKNFAMEVQKAITDLEQRKTALDKEVTEKSDRIALGDTVTNFLTRQPTYDFNRFYSMVEDLKKAREDKSSPFGPLLPRIEESIRMQALKAFEGDLVSKTEFKALWDLKEEHRKEKKELGSNVENLEALLQRKDEELASVKKEKEISEDIKVYVEGSQKTLKELKEWILAKYEEEIERRANEKFNKQAARTYGLVDWVSKKITKR